MANKKKPTKLKAKQPARARKKKQRSYKSFRLSKKISGSDFGKISYSWPLIRGTLSLFRQNKFIFFGLIFIYLTLLLVVRGFDLSSDFAAVKDSTDSLVGSDISQAESAAGLYLYAVTSSGSAGGAAQAYQLFAGLIVSLAAIWSVRQLMAGEKIRLRDSFYRGMYPLIPFLLILFVISLQLLPALAGSFLLGTVLENAIAVSAVEKFLWLVIFGLLVLLSLYMVTSSVFAIYISALPDMTPLRALRSARELVRHRRLGVAIRILAGGLFLLLVSVAVIVPLIFLASWSVEWAAAVLGGFSLVFFHSYLYRLYRELL
jgi:hypothetical protein